MWITQYFIDQGGGYRILKAVMFKTGQLVHFPRGLPKASVARVQAYSLARHAYPGGEPGSKSDSRVMYAGTPYAHLMVLVKP
jgi:hypothetical protein